VDSFRLTTCDWRLPFLAHAAHADERGDLIDADPRLGYQRDVDILTAANAERASAVFRPALRALPVR
jgi:hypothetical protein